MNRDRIQGRWEQVGAKAKAHWSRLTDDDLEVVAGRRATGRIRPIELSVKEKPAINLPLWMGVAEIVIGGGLMVFGGKRN